MPSSISSQPSASDASHCGVGALSNCSSSSVSSIRSGVVSTEARLIAAEQFAPPPPQQQQQQLWCDLQHQYPAFASYEYPGPAYVDSTSDKDPLAAATELPQHLLQHHEQQQQQQQQQQQATARPQKPKRKRVASQAQRKAANVRERRRMCNLNEAFDSLRTKVPTFAFEKRLSRIETLRLAITYIRFMGQVVSGVPPEEVRLRTSCLQPQLQPHHLMQGGSHMQHEMTRMQHPEHHHQGWGGQLIGNMSDSGDLMMMPSCSSAGNCPQQ